MLYIYFGEFTFIPGSDGKATAYNAEVVPRSGIESRLPALGALSLSHWTTREVLEAGFEPSSL